MCYMLVMSTTSNSDLSINDSSLITFKKIESQIPEDHILKNQYKWFVGSAHGCSCGFRHLYSSSVELGFEEPEDWFPEEKDDIIATCAFIRIIKALVSTGNKVDCFDAWDDNQNTSISAGTISINTSQMKDEKFRFFENHHFIYI